MPEPLPPSRERTVRVMATVSITIHDPKVIDRYSTVGEDAERPPYPGLTNEEAILGHFAYNAVANGVERVNRLDGWADLADDAARFSVEFVEVEDVV